MPDNSKRRLNTVSTSAHTHSEQVLQESLSDAAPDHVRLSRTATARATKTLFCSLTHAHWTNPRQVPVRASPNHALRHLRCLSARGYRMKRRQEFDRAINPDGGGTDTKDQQRQSHRSGDRFNIFLQYACTKCKTIMQAIYFFILYQSLILWHTICLL